MHEVKDKNRSILRSSVGRNMQRNGLVPCREPNCVNGVIIQYDNPEGETTFQCVQCSKKYCVLCLQPGHNPKQCKIVFENLQHQNFQCQNCLGQKDIEDKVGFCQCGFKLCLQCYAEYLRTAVDSFQIPKCPSGCGATLSDKFKDYLDDQGIKKFDKVIFNKVVNQGNLKICKKPNCEDGIIIQSVDQQGVIKKCARCQARYCKTCLQLEHPYKCNKEIIYELIKTFKFRVCNKCLNLVERTQGCNHMVCKCSYSFCYECEQPFQSGHSCSPFRKTTRYMRLKKLEDQIRQMKGPTSANTLNQQTRQKIVKKKSTPCQCSIM